MNTSPSESSSSSSSMPLPDLAAGLRTLLDLLDGYAYVKDTAGRYVFANKKVQELFGRSLDEIVGKDDTAFFDLDLASQLKTNDRLVIDHGQTIDREEENILSSTGEKRIYWTVKTPLRDQRGRIIGLCGISTDITARKAALSSGRTA